MGLLYGGGDPDRTITIATRCGQDSDCNPASAAGVLFTTIGYSKLPERFVSALDTTKKFNSTPYTFPKLISVCEQLADQAVVQAGGHIDKSADGQQTYVIPVQPVQPSACAPCWNPGPQAGSRFTPEEMKQIRREGSEVGSAHLGLWSERHGKSAHARWQMTNGRFQIAAGFCHPTICHPPCDVQIRRDGR